MQLMSDTDKENLHLMTSLGQWIDEDFIAISDLLGSFRGLQQSYNRLIQKSFIQSEAGKRRIFHNIVREAFYADPDYSAYSKNRNYEIIVSYYLSKLENPSLSNEDILYYTDRVIFLLNDIVNNRNMYEVIKSLIEQCRNRLQSADLQKCIAMYAMIDRNRSQYGWTEEETIAFENEYGSVLMNSGYTKKAADYYDRLYRSRTGKYGKNAPETLDALFQLTVMYRTEGRIDEAYAVLPHIHKQYVKQYGEEDPRTLEVLSAYADINEMFHGPGASVNIYQEILENYCRLYGASDHRSEETLLKLIRSTRRMNDDGEYSHIEISITDSSSGRDDSESSRDRNLRFGRMHQAAGNPDQALAYFQKALEEGADEEALNGMGLCVYECQRYEDAYPLLTQLHQYNVQSYGESDQRTVTNLKRLADVCMKTGRAEEARNHYSYLYSRNLTVLGEEHEETRFVLGRLAEINYELGNDHEALSQYLNWSELDVKTDSFYSLSYSPVSEMLIRKWKRFLPYEEGAAFYRAYFKEKSEPASSDLSDFGFRSVAPDFTDTFDDEGMIESCQRTFQKMLKKKGISHPDTLKALKQLAHSYCEANDYTEAIRTYQQLCSQYDRNPAEYNSDKLRVLKKIAHCYELKKDYEKALEILLDLCEQRKDEGIKDRDTVMRLHKTGDLLYKSGRFPEALEICRKAYPMALELLGEDDDETLDLRLDTAYALFRLQQYPEALEIFNELHKTRKRINGETDYQTIQCLEEIAFTYAAMDDLENALIVQNRYFDLYNENYHL